MILMPAPSPPVVLHCQLLLEADVHSGFATGDTVESR